MISSDFRVLSPTLKSCESGKPKQRWSEDLERLTENFKNHNISAENVVITKMGVQSFLQLTSLDNNGQFSPTYSKNNLSNTWSKNQKGLITVLFQA
jgi:hypothetical protein